MLEQTFRKFVVRPDVDQMLKDLSLKKKQDMEYTKVKKEEQKAADQLLATTKAAALKATMTKKPATKPGAKLAVAKKAASAK